MPIIIIIIIIIVGVTANGETVRHDGFTVMIAKTKVGAPSVSGRFPFTHHNHKNKNGCPILRFSAGWEVLWGFSSETVRV
jgi:hypothetical protein